MLDSRRKEETPNSASELELKTKSLRSEIVYVESKQKQLDARLQILRERLTFLEGEWGEYLKELTLKDSCAFILETKGGEAPIVEIRDIMVRSGRTQKKRALDRLRITMERGPRFLKLAPGQYSLSQE